METVKSSILSIASIVTTALALPAIPIVAILQRWRGTLKFPPPKSILITGASSGIGASLAIRLAANGVTLHLGGRQADRLQRIAAECERKGAQVHLAVVDVTDGAAMRAWIDAAEQRGPLDVCVANAGIATSGTAQGLTFSEQQLAISKVNVDGFLNTVLPAYEYFASRRRGQLIMVGSLASLCPVATSPAYPASKGFVQLYAESLRPAAEKLGVGVTLVLPGFVRTPMIEGRKFTPTAITSDTLANGVVKAIRANQPIASLPTVAFFAGWLFSCLPPLMKIAILRLTSSQSVSVEHPKLMQRHPSQLDLANGEAEIADLREQLARLQRQKSEEDEEVEEAGAAINHLQRELRGKEAILDRMKEQLSRLERFKQEGDEEVDEAAQAIAHMRTELEEVGAASEGRRVAISQLKEENNILKLELEKHTRLEEEEEEEIQDVRKELDRLNQAYQDQKTELKDVRHQLSRVQRSETDEREEIEEAQSAVLHLQKELRDAQAMLQSKEEEVIALKARI